MSAGGKTGPQARGREAQGPWVQSGTGQGEELRSARARPHKRNGRIRVVYSGGAHRAARAGAALSQPCRPVDQQARKARAKPAFCDSAVHMRTIGRTNRSIAIEPVRLCVLCRHTALAGATKRCRLRCSASGNDDNRGVAIAISIYIYHSGTSQVHVPYRSAHASRLSSRNEWGRQGREGRWHHHGFSALAHCPHAKLG